MGLCEQRKINKNMRVVQIANSSEMKLLFFSSHKVNTQLPLLPSLPFSSLFRSERQAVCFARFCTEMIPHSWHPSPVAR